MLEFRRHNDILALKSSEGKFIAYHSRNLEVAEISSEAWDVLEGGSDLEALSELQEWDQAPTISHPEARSSGINAMTLNVTQVCNLHCVYCAAGGDGTYGAPIKKISVEKTLPQLKFFMDRLEKGSSFAINFIGGEPLLYPMGIRLIAEYVQEVAIEKGLNSRFKVVTNGTLFTSENIALLNEIKAGVVVSLDGAPEVNDVRRPNRAGRGVTAQVAENLTRLQQERRSLSYFEISGVFGPGNTDVESAWNYYQQFHPDFVDFTYDHHSNDQAIMSEFVSNMTTLSADLYAQGGESLLRKIRTFDSYFDVLDSQKRVENFCGAGKNFVAVDSQNKVYTCPWDVGNSQEQVGEGTELSTKLLERYSRNLMEKEGCSDCWARFICGGGCMYIHKFTTGNKNKVDPSFCFKTRSLIALAIMYYERSRNLEELAHA